MWNSGAARSECIYRGRHHRTRLTGDRSFLLSSSRKLVDVGGRFRESKGHGFACDGEVANKAVLENRRHAFGQSWISAPWGWGQPVGLRAASYDGHAARHSINRTVTPEPTPAFSGHCQLAAMPFGLVRFIPTGFVGLDERSPLGDWVCAPREKRCSIRRLAADLRTSTMRQRPESKMHRRPRRVLDPKSSESWRDPLA